MSNITSLSARLIDDRTARVTWSYAGSAAEPTFYVWVNGRLWTTTAARSVLLTGDGGETLDCFVTDDANEIPPATYPSRIELSWDHVTGAGRYRIEELVSAVWTVRDLVIDDGRGHFRWLSRPLEDVTTHQFRVTAIGTGGNEGVAKAATVFMVRRPDAPDVSFTYDGSVAGTVTIAAA